MANIKKYTVTESYLQPSCGLAESLYYDPATNTLSFLDPDVEKRDVHTVDLTIGPSSHKIIGRGLNPRPTKLVDVVGHDDVWLCGAHDGFALMKKKTGKIGYVRTFETEQVRASRSEGIMSNDGEVDSHGRFWLGTANFPLDFVKRNGGLYRLDPDLSLHCIFGTGYAISNGISWSLDDKTMYYTDSGPGKIFAFDYDAPTGNISNKRVFFSAEGDPATNPVKASAPDGHAMDEEGYIWSAIFGASKVVRISPAGEVVAEISLPTRCITDVVFAGEDLFICAAKEWFPDTYPESVKEQGNIFKCHVGIRGKPVNKFAPSKDVLKSISQKL